MSSWQTFGHSNAKKIFDLQLSGGRLSHGYLLFGPEGIGKLTLALEFANKILQVTPTTPIAGVAPTPPYKEGELDRHPDFSLLNAQEEITVEQVQNFIQPLFFKPFVGEKKVAIINNAQLLNTQSGNALLKTLEEPSPSTIIILVSSSKQLLPTIVSRCQTFALNVFSRHELEQFAQERGFASNSAILDLSFGRIGRLMHLQQSENLKQQQERIEQFKSLQQSPQAERLLAIAELAELENVELQDLFSSWLLWEHGQLTSHPQAYTTAGELLGSLRALQTNKNKKLILQNLLLKM